MSSVPSLFEGCTPSGSSACPLCSDWSSSVIGSFVKSEQVVELGCEVLLGCFDPFWCARPPDLALPLAPFPFLFLLKTKHRKVLMRYNRKLIICITLYTFCVYFVPQVSGLSFRQPVPSANSLHQSVTDLYFQMEV